MMASETTTKREAALRLLRTGIASPSEVAEVAGVSRQLVRHWLKASGLGKGWRQARRVVLQKAWAKALHGQK